MLTLLTIPVEILCVAYFALRGLLDVLQTRKRTRFAFTVRIKASREAVWRFNLADRIVLDGPPTMEFQREPLAGSPNLFLTRVVIGGQLRARSVSYELERDETKGIVRARTIAHPLSAPPEAGRGVESGLMLGPATDGTTLTMFGELTARSFRERILYPLGLRRITQLIKQQCEKEAGTGNRLAAIGNNGLLLSALAILSFWYLLGWQLGLFLTAAIVLHEAGHAAAMVMTGVGVRGVYLVPFFGGAAVPKTAYQTERRLGIVALMGPCPSLIPTLGLLAMYQLTGQDLYGQAAEMFAVINASNLLPIYPLDGGLILNALIGSVNQKAAFIAGWIGVATGLGLAVYFESYLIGVPFLLFALQRYLSGGGIKGLKPLSLTEGIALALASIATFVTYVLVLRATWEVPPLDI